MAAKFSPARLQFGRAPSQDDDGEGLPRPITVRALARRAAGIAEAKASLDQLPGPGESLHLVFTARMDLADLLNALLEKLGRCDRMRIATLGFNSRNLRMMLSWLDTGAVGSLTLLASLFWKAHNPGLWDQTRTELRSRNNRAACAASHAKVCVLSFASGLQLALEGSSNLCSSGSGREQVAIINDPVLCAWHSEWIEAMVAKVNHESPDNGSDGAEAG